MNNNTKNDKKKINNKEDKKKDVKEKKILKNNEFFLKEKIKKLKKKIMLLTNNFNDLNLRSRAEIENMRRRNEQEIEKIYKFSLEDFVHELLPTIDNLEKSVELAKKKKIDISILKGIELTLKSFLDTIIKFGVTIIKDLKEEFNPKIHQAISIRESNKIENNKVLEIMQKGYLINNRLLRPAMVIVSKNTKK
ncbi:nucleotide exchange factor GrpE [Candidatus Annandia adelgestsuga]|uniref:nucleotide exchange factor GrpE n=1 Tax=Candidatus Annandia adelgestsuga TaxID=1302411 RepID=UPI000F7DE087|nr:nucleotide exchange factor GrpE [Candidatus Annandia adelgestsuga]